MITRLFTLILFFLCAVTGGHAEDVPKTLRLLTVGNSFAYNATKFLPDLAKASGNKIEIHAANFRGASLELHWKTAQLAENGKSSGAIYPPKKRGAPKRTLKDFLQDGTWDIITIQQASALSDDATTYRPFGPNLVAYLKKYAPQAEIVIHETWAYRNDDPQFKGGSTPATMHDGLRRAYRELGEELGLRVVPVGDAFALAATRPEWTFRADASFDPSTINYPEVPPQPHSLHVGWTWFMKSEGPKFALDGHHANIFGQYLGSCVFYEFLFNRSVIGNPFVPTGITPDQARSLQEIAHEVRGTVRAQAH